MTELPICERILARETGLAITKAKTEEAMKKLRRLFASSRPICDQCGRYMVLVKCMAWPGKPASYWECPQGHGGRTR